jgi:hypothetical protein
MVRARLRKRGISGYAHLVPYLLVLGLSLLVGAAVYLATVRAERDVPALGFGDDFPGAGPPEGAAPAAAQVLVPAGLDGGRRSTGSGFIGAIVLGPRGAARAFAIYQGGHLINLMLKSFLGS